MAYEISLNHMSQPILPSPTLSVSMHSFIPKLSVSMHSFINCPVFLRRILPIAGPRRLFGPVYPSTLRLYHRNLSEKTPEKKFIMILVTIKFGQYQPYLTFEIL